jgi:hypothetical protein
VLKSYERLNDATAFVAMDEAWRKNRDGYSQELRPYVNDRLVSALVAAVVSIDCAGALLSATQGHLVSDGRCWRLGLRLPSGGL